MAEQSVVGAEHGERQVWTFDCVRNRRGVYVVHSTDPQGELVTEPLAVAVAADRSWSNPPDEIEHLSVLAQWLKDHSEERRMLRAEYLPSHGGAFTHPGVVMQHAEVVGMSYWHEDDVGCYQGAEGPLHLVIGRRASDEKLMKAAQRCGVDFEVLRAFREEDMAHG